MSLLSWLGRGTSGRSRCCKPESTAQLRQPWGVSCDELGLPMACPCLPALNPIQENTDLSSWFAVTLLVVADSCKSAGEDCDGSCHLSHTVTVKATVQPVYSDHQTHLQGTRARGWICLFVSHGVWSPLPFHPNPTLILRYYYQRCLSGMLCWPLAIAWRSHPAVCRLVLHLFQPFFSSPMKTWSSWYLTSLRKVYALSQVNRFFRTLAKSSVHNLDASPSLQNYAKELKKRTQA